MSVHEIALNFARVLNPYRGQRLLGVVDGCDCVEVVFSERLDRGNLLCFYFHGGKVSYSHGYVRDPVAYINGCGIQVDEERAA